MRTKTSQRRGGMIAALQERIDNINREIERLNNNRTLYHRIIEEITNQNSEDNGQESQGSESELSIEVFQDNNLKTEKDHIIRQKTTKKEERQVAFEKDRAWALDRRRPKRSK
jgi:TolA-binding protein